MSSRLDEKENPKEAVYSQKDKSYEPLIKVRTSETNQGHGIWAAGLFAIVVGSALFNMEESYDHVTFTKKPVQKVEKQFNYSQYTCPPKSDKINGITPELESLIDNAHKYRKTVLIGTESIKYDFTYLNKNGKENKNYDCSLYSIKK